jgi:hypothetical protein
MTSSNYLPPSLRTVPNRNLRDLSLEELKEERDYYEKKLSESNGWGAVVGEYHKMRKACDRVIAEREPATAEREAEKRYRYTTVDTWPERHAVTRERSAFIDGWQAREQLEWKPGDLRCEHCDNGAETGWGWCPWCGQILPRERS